MRRKSVKLLLIASMILSLTGCSFGTAADAPKASSEEIVLVDPVNAEVSLETVATRNLYNANVYAATVLPVVREYAPDYAFNFSSYGAFLGDTVKVGQQLVSANTEKVDEDIKNKKEYIASMEEEYQKYVTKQQETIDEYRRQERNAKWAYDQYENAVEPLQIEDEESGEMVDNPEYPTWKAQHDRFEGDYRIAKHAADTAELALEQRAALYELDHTHQLYLLKQLQKSRQNATLTSQISGEVVALADLGSNDYLRADVPVVAVGDMSQMILKCDYINKNTIKNAEDVYALIDGKRYKVNYQEISSDEYARQSANGKVYSTFYFAEDVSDVNIGDYAVIAVITKKYENVVSIPKDSIHRDEMGRYVYLYEDGKSIRTNVTLGYSDGMYTEITSGLKAGDQILYANPMTVNPEGTKKLTTGEFHSEFSERAELTYTITEGINNPVENGTTYFGEYQVEMFQHVNKGDVIATVRVEPDKLALTRNETRLTRLKERLADYVKEHEKDTKDEAYQEAIKNYEDQIKDVEEAIAKQKKDFSTKQIVAPRTGVVLYMQKYENESIVQKGAFIAEIADEGNCYVKVEDESQNLQYGNEVSVEYMDAEQRTKSVRCKVVTMAKIGVSGQLQTNSKNLLLPQDAVEDVLQGAIAGEWWNRYRYTVNANVREMKNVVIVPRAYVYNNGNKTYVYVKDENGNAKAQSFVAGGFNDTYYWVVEGLTEGMEICSK